MRERGLHHAGVSAMQGEYTGRGREEPVCREHPVSSLEADLGPQKALP